MPGHDELGDGPTGVVGHERDLVEVERSKGVGDHAGEAGRREVGAFGERAPVRPERPVGHDQPVAGDVGEHAVPQPSVDEQAVDEHHRRTGTLLSIPNRACGNLDRCRHGRLLAAVYLQPDVVVKGGGS
jgi:hypothetical protein